MNDPEMGFLQEDLEDEDWDEREDVGFPVPKVELRTKEERKGIMTKLPKVNTEKVVACARTGMERKAYEAAYAEIKKFLKEQMGDRYPAFLEESKFGSAVEAVGIGLLLDMANQVAGDKLPAELRRAIARLSTTSMELGGEELVDPVLSLLTDNETTKRLGQLVPILLSLK